MSLKLRTTSSRTVQSARIALCTNTAAIPGAVPEAPSFELYDDAAQQAALAVELAEKYATNVAPATVPEAAGRAAQSEVQADLAGARAAFVAPGSAVLALASGRLLQLLLQVCGPRVVALCFRCQVLHVRTLLVLFLYY
jgi:hypothetical protein